MSKPSLHQHACGHCMAPVECSGEWVSNHDGWPEVVCDYYHEGDPADFLCEECGQKQEHGRCEDCGAWYQEKHHPACEAWKAAN